MYTAYDFWRDLMELFGDAEKAKAVAIDYLDTITAQQRTHGEDPEELAFCKVLYSIISA